MQLAQIYLHIHETYESEHNDCVVYDFQLFKRHMKKNGKSLERIGNVIAGLEERQCTSR